MSKRISKIIPSFLVDKASCTRQFESELSLHSLASLFPIKEGSTFLTKPLFPQGREDVTALRCSEPLRYKVGGPSRVYAILCGMGPPGDNKLQLKVKIGISTFIYLLPLRLFKEGDIVTLQLYNL